MSFYLVVDFSNDQKQEQKCEYKYRDSENFKKSAHLDFLHDLTSNVLVEIVLLLDFVFAEFFT